MAKSNSQIVRIIGGKWKGRKLRFAGDASLRPTLGRTRETLFNWLRPHLAGQTCLDLFAGSGILGFEALSNRAAHCHFVDTNRQSIKALDANIQLLDATSCCDLIHADALTFLRQAPGPYDVVFLDPPFSQPSLLSTTLDRIMTQSSATKYVYLEVPSAETITQAIEDYDIQYHKQTRAGDTYSALLFL